MSMSSALRRLTLHVLPEVPLEGVEPPLTCVNMDLNHARLPIPPQRPVVNTAMMSNRGAKPQAGKVTLTATA